MTVKREDMPPPIKVLLVDDEQRFLSTTAKILERKGLRVLIAGSGEEGLEKMSESPHVIVLDRAMKGMDGETALGYIRAQHPGIPVIILTGHGEQANAEQMLAQGAFDYLAKPIDIDLLACKINEAFHYGVSNQGSEKVAGDLMTPLDACMVFPPETPLGVALEMAAAVAVSRTDDPINKAVLKFGFLVSKGEGILGILSMREIINLVRPPYLADTEYRRLAVLTTGKFSPIFWNGMFEQRLNEIAEIPLGGIMALPPPTVSTQASIMELCDQMMEKAARQLIVMDGDRTVGIVCDQDLMVEAVQLAGIRTAMSRTSVEIRNL